MPNHVHLIVVPRAAESLRRAIDQAHRRYTRWTNFREGWRGHLRQGRFGFPGRVAPGDCSPGAPTDPYVPSRAYGSSYHELATGRLPE